MAVQIRVPLWAKKIVRRAKFYLALRAHASISGSSYYIDPTVHILRLSKVKIGRKSVVSAYCTININNTSSDAAGLIIGDYCWIGIRNFFSPGSSLKIGDYVLTGPDCSYLGANHVFEDPMQPYVTTGTDAEAQTVIGANVWLGAGVTVLGGVRIGHGSVIGARSVVTKDVPPFSVAVGIPAGVIKRYDPTIKAWVNAACLSKEAEAELPLEQEYISALKEKSGDFNLPLLASGKSMGNLP